MNNRTSLSVQFSAPEIERIQNRFNEFALDNKMDRDAFKKSMGLLGIGEC